MAKEKEIDYRDQWGEEYASQIGKLRIYGVVASGGGKSRDGRSHGFNFAIRYSWGEDRPKTVGLISDPSILDSLKPTSTQSDPQLKDKKK